VGVTEERGKQQRVPELKQRMNSEKLELAEFFTACQNATVT